MESSQEIIRQVGALSYLGIFGLSFFANMVVPVPEEIVMLALGYVAGTGTINFWITLGIVIIGALLSDIGMYLLSRNNNRWVKGFYNRVFAKMLPVDQAFLEAHNTKVVFASRFLVQLRFIGPFIAGQSKMPWKKFIAYDLLALTIYVPSLMWAGHYFAHRIDSIFNGVNQAKNIVLVVAGILIIWSLSKVVRDYFIKIIKK